MQFDLHTHVLPGIDDGSPSMEVSLEMLKMAADDGTTHMVTTPHGNSGNFMAQLKRRDRVLKQLREAMAGLHLNLVLIPGMEVQINERIWDMLKEKPQALYNAPEKEVLATTPLLGEIPWGLNLSLAADIFFQAQLRGYTLVLAHPERYFNFSQHLDTLKQLSDQGMYLQFNATSFAGWENFFRRRRILQLIRHNPEQILLASDTHNLTSRPPLLSPVRPFLEKYLGRAIWRQITEINPSRMLGIKA